jgi:hypothetical protein
MCPELLDEHRTLGRGPTAHVAQEHVHELKLIDAGLSQEVADPGDARSPPAEAQTAPFFSASLRMCAA